MLEEIENNTLPYALMIGVEYDLFWTLNPKSLSPFIKAFSLRQKYDDSVAWQSGAYIRMAIASCMDKGILYPKKPFSDKLDNNYEVKDDVMSPAEIRERFMAHALLLNSNFRKEV